MKDIPKFSKKVIALAALAVGLSIGFGIGHVQLKKEQTVFQEKIKEANKKIAFIERKLTELKYEAGLSAATNCQDDQNKIETLSNEKKSLVGQLGKAAAEMKRLESRIKESEEASARTRKDLLSMERKNKDLDSELKKTTVEKKNFEAKLKKTTDEKQALEANIKKTTGSLDRCESDNAELCSISADLINKYRNKGLGTILMGSEPLTQIKKVELEKFTQKYQEEIERQKIKK